MQALFARVTADREGLEHFFLSWITHRLIKCSSFQFTSQDLQRFQIHFQFQAWRFQLTPGMKIFCTGR